MSLKRYKSELTVTVNSKGVLDVDTVKGCTAGLSYWGDAGCYGCCYAAKIAAFRGWDFSHSVTRYWKDRAQFRYVARELWKHRDMFVRVGTMGDPCHDWPYLEAVVRNFHRYNPEWVIVTKHWHRASDLVLASLIGHGVCINTSISALDGPDLVAHRLSEYRRYRDMGGNSVLRVVTADFNRDTEAGAVYGEVQDRLVSEPRYIDTPLRVPGKAYPLLAQGVIRAEMVEDLNGKALTSLWKPDVYMGWCEGCPDRCGLPLPEGER